MSQKPKLTEEERLAKLRKLDNTPSPNPEYRGQRSDETQHLGQPLPENAGQVQLAWMMLLDSIHHRRQLSTYLRPMGSKVPAIYGPSADDEGPGH